MAKRRTADLSESSGTEGSSPRVKRARRNSPSEHEQPLNGRSPKKHANGREKGKRKVPTDVDEGQQNEDEEVGIIPDAIIPDDDEFEEKHGEAIKAAIDGRPRGQGGIAEMGIIQKVEMVNFMCHKYLQFTFGPQVNFIIGHNGSGKSAVLSAITVALGGKATSTGRGSGLKSFIKEGESVSEVSITIKNGGSEPFSPEKYGDSIKIIRKFSKEGSSSYKIQSKNGKTISTKREELSAICDHMNIQVDNPMNILTQDSARQFLSASHPTDKYTFFLKGTQLTQLSEEYETILENIVKTGQILKQKKEVLPDLEKAFIDASSRYKEAEKARVQADKIEELEKELAWAHVAKKQAELEQKIQEVQKGKRRLVEIQKHIEEAEAQVQVANCKVSDIEAQVESIPNIDDLLKKKEEVTQKLKINKQKLMDANNDQKKMNASVLNQRKIIEGLEKQIAEETLKLQVDSQAKREELQRKLDAVAAETKVAEAKLLSIQAERRDHNETMTNSREKGAPIEIEIQQLKRDLENAQSQLARLESNKHNKLNAFGSNIPTVLDDIARATWIGNRPVGPLGMFVDLSDGRWAGVMRSVIGGMMMAFAITRDKDRDQLKRILQSRGNRSPQIVVTSKDMFDYRAGEPPSHLLTILRALEFKDEWVKRILINSRQIERTCLAETRQEGQNLVDANPQYTCFTTDLYKLQRYADGGAGSQALQRLGQGDARQLLFTTGNVESQIEGWKRQCDDIRARGDATDATLQQLKRDYSNAQEAGRFCAEEERRMQLALHELKAQKTALENEGMQEAPVNINVLEHSKMEAEAELQATISQFTAVSARKEAIENDTRPLLQEKENLRLEIERHDGERDALRVLVETAAQERVQAQANQTHYEGKLQHEQEKVDKLEQVASVVEQEFENWSEKAAEICTQVENPRSTEKIEGSIKSLRKALADQTRRNGASIEQIRVELDRTQTAMEKAKLELRSMYTFNKNMGNALKTRMSNWHAFRMHIALRCKYQFQYHLANRGFFGRVLFDHSAGTLNLKVQTDDQVSTQSRDKDPKSMSGGEKSFSTICLLLSLWEAIGCPIRALDEFDVFMDSVNRRISMKMMIETAKSSDRKQYILITPQDMTNITLGPEVRVHRMNDPERGQGTLRF